MKNCGNQVIFEDMKMRALKYLLALVLPISVSISFTQSGALTFLPLLIAFGAIPFVELFIKADPSNLNEAQAEIVGKDRLYDFVLYLMVPLQYLFLVWYVFSIKSLTVSDIDFWGRTVSMGLLCGAIGINVAHELGHRTNKFEQLLAKVLLASSLYSHFFIEHNYGHHRHVATPEDPATARYNESVYVFWLRSIWQSYWSAWHIQMAMLKHRKQGFLSSKNQMLWFQMAHLTLLAFVFWLGGVNALLGFLLAAVVGMFLLETVNYIEHYGLQRRKVSDKRYENTTPAHSWNSNHVLGRLMLYELSRHSDHHAHPHKPYQLLEHHNNSPQLPTGYPGMMLLALFPPVFFRVMNPKISA